MFVSNLIKLTVPTTIGAYLTNMIYWIHYKSYSNLPLQSNCSNNSDDVAMFTIPNSCSSIKIVVVIAVAEMKA